MLFTAEANAQMGKMYYINGGWQFNGTVANDFVECGQGYGAYIEGGCSKSRPITAGSTCGNPHRDG